MEEAVSLRQLYSKYSSDIQFLVIYIREAHPIDGWDVYAENRLYAPKTIEERRKVATACHEAMKHGIQTYVDEMDDKVMVAYAASPERLYLVGKDGRIAYAGDPGPAVFSPTELKEAIEIQLAAN